MVDYKWILEIASDNNDNIYIYKDNELCERVFVNVFDSPGTAGGTVRRRAVTVAIAIS